MSAPTRCSFAIRREAINSIRELVATLDIPVRQVLIESRIVIADDSFNRDLGVRFGVSYAWNNGNRQSGNRWRTAG